MKCPCCKSELIVTGQERIEDISEHVCDPNGTPSLKDVYTCSNGDCPTIGICQWIPSGELCTNGGKYDEFKKIKFINSNTGPFGSYSRKSNVEIYKDGLKKKSKEITLFNRIQFFYEYNYTSNEDGDVLSTSKRLKMILRNGDLWVYGSFPWETIYYIFNSFNRCLKRYEKDKDNEYIKKELYKDFYVSFKSEKRIIYRFCRFLLRILHWRLHKELKEFYKGKLGYEFY